jgi:hypothetical protein
VAKNKIIKLGVVGISEGNGHPYSWSAIFNGYELDLIKECGFPVIPEYLSLQKFPENFLSKYGKVTSVFTQNKSISQHISNSCFIEHIAESPEDLIQNVDAILFARDDSENHLKMTLPYINSGLPIFIDKPFALTLEDANTMLNAQKYSSQIFTCSSFRFADELILTKRESDKLGEINFVKAQIPKKWSTYAVHLLEPIVVNVKSRGRFVKVVIKKEKNYRIYTIFWENLEAELHLTNTNIVPISFEYHGNKKSIKKIFNDSFNCFKNSLHKFVYQAKTKKNIISRDDTLEIVKILEKGI